MPVVKARGNWALIKDESKAERGPLIIIQTGNGRGVKMYQSDAIAQGLITDPDQKQKKTGKKNKMKTPGGDKKADPDQEKDQDQDLALEADDLSEIPGIGKATARKLEAQGIQTFEALLEAPDLSFLSEKALASVEAWKDSLDG